ncbi:MAG TPA: ABC transporter ATP-binding protein [Spirochaetota bacterium]|nr:ABC transporter ATP-binding protein [Spirochaetota bacterium]HPC42367.1 ABC transporter ATP-binding protein [Spirochaetota bacterium]HPL16415.1 ABC transporter ATP-binding protein [Spirochaetota bacterium]HQJ69776.1 ABC transporter ATP-binding protein [Spirochaetota bacterium]HRS76436.1 ABC transporter ATP-binding protein [Spirochaetota bacterium]
MNDTGIAIIAEHISKIYRRGSDKITALDGVSLRIRRGDFVAFVGPSGSGKTTLLNILGCLDNPTDGALSVGGTGVFGEGTRLGEKELTKIRRQHFGYIFQNFYLLPTLTVRENVTVPFSFYRKDNAVTDIPALLASLGIERRMNHLPGQLSGGEMQRVAIARALVNRPEILLADEPTGNLDSKRSRDIGEVLGSLNRDQGITIIMVTHNPELAALAGRQIDLRDGRI